MRKQPRIVGAAVVLALFIPLATQTGVAASAGAPAGPETAAELAAPTIPLRLRILVQRVIDYPPVRLVARYTKDLAVDLLKDATKDWLASGGTTCTWPLPEKFCAAKVDDSVWGLGQALGRPDGSGPRVWTTVDYRRVPTRYYLVPREVYYLRCWTVGDYVTGTYKRTNLWYWVGTGYVTDAQLATGSTLQIPRVTRC